MQANQLRLWFASLAYVMLGALRRIALAHTEFAQATCGTIRLKLLKIGAGKAQGRADQDCHGVRLSGTSCLCSGLPGMGLGRRRGSLTDTNQTPHRDMCPNNAAPEAAPGLLARSAAESERDRKKATPEGEAQNFNSTPRRPSPVRNEG